MNRWEHLHLAVYWNGTRTQVRAVYANGQKVEALSTVERPVLLKYLNDLRCEGWEKFAHTPPFDSMLEIYYFERPLAGEEGLIRAFSSFRPLFLVTDPRQIHK